MLSEYHIPLSKARRTAMYYDLIQSTFRMSGGGGFNERLHDSVYADRIKLMSLELPMYHGDPAVCLPVGVKRCEDLFLLNVTDSGLASVRICLCCMWRIADWPV
jgi:hypothetical protein